MPAGRRQRAPRRRAGAAATLSTGLAASLAAGACATPAAPPPHDGAASTVVIATPPAAPDAPDAAEPPDAVAKLRPYVVVHPAAARQVLFTWTTREQIVELARDRALLTRAESPTRGPSFYDAVLAQRAEAGDGLAAVLRGGAFARARFAWPAPWATFLGWEGETYGEDLVQVTLKPTAWIAKLVTSSPSLEVVDLDDQPVPMAEALRHPERIAAVYFVHDTPGRAGRGTYSRGLGTYGEATSRLAYREYVLCNESMIEAWSVGTDEIAAAIEAGAAAADALRRHVAARPPKDVPIEAWNGEVARAVWPGGGLGDGPQALYEASLSFPNASYFPTAQKLAKLAERLRALPRRPPAI